MESSVDGTNEIVSVYANIENQILNFELHLTILFRAQNNLYNTQKQACQLLTHGMFETILTPIYSYFGSVSQAKSAVKKSEIFLQWLSEFLILLLDLYIVVEKWQESTLDEKKSF